ncbi:MAG: YibE/F family protein [Actinomycetota bacterium]|nr:YibE/F family protein [Actinomycetota bacterium]
MAFFRVLTGVVAVATVVGLILLWPGEVESKIGEGIASKSEAAEIERVEEFACQGGGAQRCRRAVARLQSGPETGRRAQLELGTGEMNPDLSVGDVVRVVRNAVPPGAELPPGQRYNLTDFERRTPLLLLALLFAGLVVVFGRFRGALSLVGLALSLAIVGLFVVPAILEGESPLVVAAVGSFAVMLTTVTLAHGLGPKSLAAILGTAVSLLLTIALAVLFTELTHLTGLSSEEAAFLQLSGSNIDVGGLLLAGMVIGALGVLDDVTISQASTVLALRGANPSLGRRELFSRALHVGRDHVTATVNTLVLAYVGASLPLLVIFSSTELGFVETATLEIVAKEIVATLVGSVGLIAAVPLTTALAALLSTSLGPSDMPSGELGHVH